MDLIEQELFNRAIVVLQKKFSGMDNIIELTHDRYDGTFDVGVRILGVRFSCMVEKTVTTANFNWIIQSVFNKGYGLETPILLVTRYIKSDLLGKCVDLGVNVLHSVGNFFIRYMRDGRLVFHLSNTGERSSMPEGHSIFMETGIRVIFYLLNNFENVNKPYREIQKATGVSVGSVKNVMDELINRHHVLVTERGRFLKNRKDLLDRWTIDYTRRLKPKLLLGRMTFRDNERRANWLEMKLPYGMFWGGECGAYIADPYLEPGAFDIYTDVPSAYLMRTGCVRQDPDGEICIYRKFWQEEAENRLVPPVLIYADLMGSGNSRCIETAQRLLDNGLKHFK